MSTPASTAVTSPIPSGGRLCTTFPEILMLGEFVFGGLVWILVASGKVPFAQDQGWVMFVSVFCFVVTTLLLILYLAGVQKRNVNGWLYVDVFYHFIAAIFYLSAAVLETSNTRLFFVLISPKIYKLNIAATVFAYVATLFYTIHAMGSIIRWKSS